ncbi:MAG: hypothetical protein ACKVS6_00395 [Planctomycetota bacterium]
MNFARIHLILSHFPIAGLVFGLLLIVGGEVTKKPWLQKAGWILVVLSSFLGAATYWTGEGAEDVLGAASNADETAFGDATEMVEAHEDRAVYALWSGAAAGMLSLISLWTSRGKCEVSGKCKHAPGLLRILTLLVTACSVAAVVWTASLGGDIRHSEIRMDAPAAQTQPK